MKLPEMKGLLSVDTNNAIAVLNAKITKTCSTADRLSYSIGRVAALGLVPLTLPRLAVLTDAELEAMDAFIYRYGSLVSNIQDAIFKSIGEVELEPVSTMSNRDKTNLMERLGALPSADEFSTLAYIRNKLMHEYPEEAQKQLDRTNFITHEAPRLIEVFIGITQYAKKFGLHFSIAEYAHLSHFANSANSSGSAK